MGVDRYTTEFKDEAVKQVTERGYSVQEVADRLGVTTTSLYRWMDDRGVGRPKDKLEAGKFKDLAAENARLKAENKRLQEERDILKKAAAYFAKESR